ncbi:MAG: hypothetical protein JWO02_389 [Solirubrobacterales bacterium]|nr:hypothetical protein [Solirubrobacterales bacterium]
MIVSSRWCVPTLALLLLVATGADPALSAGTTNECAKRAEVLSGAVDRLGAVRRTGDAPPTVDRTAVRRLDRRSGSYYVTGSDSVVAFQHLHYHVDAHTIFDLECGGAAGEAARAAVLNVSMGAASVSVEAGGTGGLATDEGYLDPYANKAQSFRISRVPRGAPSLKDVLLSTAPPQFGTTVGTQIAGAAHGAYMNITPYVGAKAGQCHQAHGTQLVSTGIDAAHQRYRGQATYTGLANFSPRP